LNEEFEMREIPPVENFTRGKTFRPSNALRNKYWFTAVSFAVITWLLVLLGTAGIMYIVAMDEGWIGQYITTLNQLIPTISFWTWVAHAVWFVPAVIIIPIYIRSIEYAVVAESGEALPEIYVRKGLINVTRKHVPLRTITNISSRQGLIDRLFGIGNVEIETAGYSGPQQYGPEEKMEGIKQYHELAEFVLSELRRFRAPYSTGTEVVTPDDEQVPRLDDSLQDEILIAIRDIREILRTKL
jgi:membrane protein YdbS with pleckstrin-like domain